MSVKSEAAVIAKFGAQTPNRGGEYRLRVSTPPESETLLAWLNQMGAWHDIIEIPGKGEINFVDWLPTALLKVVTAEHFLHAAHQLAGEMMDHSFQESADFEVIFDVKRLWPNALLGLADSKGFGRDIFPANFTGGTGSQCFRMIEAAGYSIVGKGEDLPAAKPAHFRAQYGKLFCEIVKMDPIAQFKEDGEAWTEIHHATVFVSDMAPGH